YQGQVLFVPMRYISLTQAANSEPDISFVPLSNQNTGSGQPNFPGNNTNSMNFSVAPIPATTILNTQTPQGTSGTSLVCMGAGLVLSNGFCCPQGFTYNGNVCNLTLTTMGGQVTWYVAGDGRVDGNAGDRIAIYCRQSGRIEVWSINNSQGHFLVDFRHE